MRIDLQDKQTIYLTLEEAEKNNFFENKSIVIFGCTIYARDIREFFHSHNIPVAAFIDNNPQKKGKKCLGITIYSPEDFFASAENYVVVIASKYNLEMKGQLISLGVQSAQIVDIPVSESCCSEGDSLAGLENNLNKIRKGYEIYEKFIAKYKEVEMVFLCPYPGTGDIYMACGYLNHFLEKENIKKYLLLVIGNNCKKIADLYFIENIEVINAEEKDLLLRMWEFIGDSGIKIKPLLHWGWRTKRFLLSNFYPHITFNEMFKHDTYGLSEECVFVHPDVNRESNYACELFHNLGLKKEKTVIIAPYAGSFVSSVSRELWKKIAEKLKVRGYDVCTNGYGENEPAIEGTMLIQFPYNEVVNVLEYAGNFISIRSGLCDIASSSKCKMLIIYENGFNASDYEYFSLKKMMLKDDVREIIFENETKLLYDIFSEFDI